MNPRRTLGTSPPPRPLPHAYRDPAAISLLVAFAPAVIFLVVMMVGMLNHLTVDAVVEMTLAAVLFVTLYGLILVPPSLSHLVITPREIVYHAIGYTIRAPWADAADIGTLWAGRQRVRGVVLLRPEMVVRPWLAAALRVRLARTYFTLLNRYPLPMLEGNADYRQFIPVDLFGTQRRPGQGMPNAWDAIEAYAPQLFGVPDPSPTRRLGR